MLSSILLLAIFEIIREIFLIFCGCYIQFLNSITHIIFFIYHIPVYYRCIMFAAAVICQRDIIVIKKREKRGTSMNYHANRKYLSKHPLFSACIITRHVTVVDVFIM